MKKTLEASIEILFCLIALGLIFWFVSTFQSDREIPPEPEDQLSESVEQGWGAPRSSQWASVRKHHVIAHPFCEACGSDLDLNVHHVEPFHVRPELELEPSNLITLCREHHFRIGHDPDGPWKPQRPSWKASNPKVREHSKRMMESLAN